MPDLDRVPVLDWVSACAPEVTTWCPAPVRSIEEDREILAALVDLGHALDIPRQLFEHGNAAGDLHAVLLQLGPARLLRLLGWLGNEGDEERAAVLAALLGGVHGDAVHLKAIFQALHRRELLGRIFDETRLQLLLAATRTTHEGDTP